LNELWDIKIDEKRGTWNIPNTIKTITEKYKVKCCRKRSLTSTTHDAGPFGKNRTAPLHDKIQSIKILILI
jgi:hypothetical protein